MDRNASYRFSDADSTSIAKLSWREVFTDVKLQALIDTALVNNTDLRIAYLKTEEAKASLLTSRMSFLPSVSFSPEASTGMTAGDVTRGYSLNLSADWEVDLFGKLRNSKEAAKAVLEQSYAYSQAVRTNIVAEVASCYYTLVMLDAQMDISRSTVLNWKEYISTLKSLKYYGTVDESAIAQAEAAKAGVEASVLTLQQQIYSVENALSLLLGKEPGHIERNGIDEMCVPDTLSAGIPLQLLHYRPDVREAELRLAQAFYLTNAAYSSFYPSISLSGIAGWKNDGGITISNPGDWIFNAVASLIQPLLNRGENIARLKVAKAQQEEALLDFRQSVLAAGVEVNDAVVALQTARDRLLKDEEQIEALSRSLQSTELLMEHGTVNYLEVLTAAQNLLQAKLDMVEDRYNEINGMISLYHAVGGGVF